MNAADLRRSLSGHYRYDEARRIFLPQRDKPFAYSDGDAAEAYLAQVVAGAADLAVGSPELAARIRDWPSQYHLSPLRANLLRPVAHCVRGLVLEIGAGCGAITRYLGESGATVLALEGSPARAAIAASRCRDLPNVVVVCDRFDDLPLEVSFDLVTLVGVLEYSRMFGAGDDPVQAMLARAGGYLAPDGVLALAIENQLGLRYLAGAPEDHLGDAYRGVEDRYGPRTPVTFGRLELQERLLRAGYEAARCLYPYPDYKLPSVVVTEAGFASRAFDVAALASTTSVRRAGGEAPLAFSESLARGAFLRNGLGPSTANAFLFVAGGAAAVASGMPPPGTLAFCYASGRDRPYAKETCFAEENDGIAVHRRRLFAQPPPATATIRQRLTGEGYLPGEVLHSGLERLVANEGWTLDDLARWAQPWVEYLREQARGLAGHAAAEFASEAPVAPALFDCMPFNVVRRPDGSLAAFDLEWEPARARSVTLARVVFRGLWNSLARLDAVARPDSGVPQDIASLTGRTMALLGIAADDAALFEWIRAEYAFSREVAGIAGEPEAFVPVLDIRGATAQPVPAFADSFATNDPSGAATPVFAVKAYLRGPGADYGEERSCFAAGAREGGRIAALLAVPPQDEPIEAIRVDPMDCTGLFRLERIALLSGTGQVLWETRRCRAPDLTGMHHLLDLSAFVASATGCVQLATGGDPHFEIAAPAPVREGLAKGGAILVEMAGVDAVEIAALGRFLEIADAYLVNGLRTTPEALEDSAKAVDRLKGEAAGARAREEALQARLTLAEASLAESAKAVDRLKGEAAGARAREEALQARLTLAEASLAEEAEHGESALRRESQEARRQAAWIATLDFRGLPVPERIAQARSSLERMAGELGGAAQAFGREGRGPQGAAVRMQSLDRASAARDDAQAVCAAAIVAIGESLSATTRELELGRIRLQAGLGHTSRQTVRLAELTARVAELEGEVARRRAELVQLDGVLAQSGHRFVTRLGTILAPYPALRAALRAPLRVLRRLARKTPS